MEKLTVSDRELIRNSMLMQGLLPTQIAEALKFLDARIRRFDRGELIQRMGEPVERFGLVLEGTIQVYADDLSGQPVIMNTVSRGGAFGEALCYLGTRESPVAIEAMADTRVLTMSARGLREEMRSEASCEMNQRYTAMLARKLLDMNDRVQVLSKQTIREKLMTYLTQQAHARKSRSFSVPFDRQNMATFLGVNRSALSRELSELRDEGIIEFYKNRFTLL